MRSPAALLALSLLLGPLAACGGDHGPDDPGATPPATSAGRPVVVDTDLASDDLVALTFLLSSAEVDVRAITVSGTGEVRCPRGVEVALGVLAVTGVDGVPVACGRQTPLAGDHAFPTEWRDAADDAWGLALPDVEAPASTPTAVDLLARTLAPGDTTLLTLGPLTNVAEAFRAHPDLAGQVRSVVVMGGAVDVGGNAHLQSGDSATAEWNLYVDPTAADEVLGSGAPIVLVGLDASGRAPVDRAFLDLLAANTHTTAAGLVATLLAGNPQVASGEAYFWDPLAAAAVVDAGLLTTEVARIDVVTEEGTDSGRTRRDPGGSRVTVAVDTDADAFERLLVRTLDGLGSDDELVLPPEPLAEGALRYDGRTCRYEGPAEMAAGRLRLSFDSSDPGWDGAVLRLSGTRSARDVLDWIAAHPGDARWLRDTVQDATVLLRPGPNEVDVPDGEVILVCASGATAQVLAAGAIAVG